jgi:hypothetical protein
MKIFLDKFGFPLHDHKPETPKIFYLKDVFYKPKFFWRKAFFSIDLNNFNSKGEALKDFLGGL